MKESDIQSGIMCALGSHPDVVWCMVVTTGKFRIKGGFITTGHYMTGHEKQSTGMSDIIGMTIEGTFFCIEVKKPNEKPTKEQCDFMELVAYNSGLSGWATNVEEAINIIEG